MQRVQSRSARTIGVAVVTALAVLIGAGAAGAVAPAEVAPAEVAPAEVAPITGGGGRPVVFTQLFDLADVGYQQSEFSLTGTAQAYEPEAGTELAPDGRWAVTPTSQAAFTTRVVVYRPLDDHDFSGTVFVEWLNVSGGLDAGPDWTLAHNEMIRRGHAWVGVSAQAVGLNATKAGDPVRYASLVHPGDSYSYDMFSQAGTAVRDEAETVLGGLRPRHVIALGESQSASRMVTYLDAVHPLAEVYDGFFVHSRGVRGAALSQSPQAAVSTPTPTLIRDDLDVPVFVLQAETDALRTIDARQPDTRRFRLWEVAGSAHADMYGLGVGFNDLGDGQGAKDMFELMLRPTNRPLGLFECALPVNAGPHHWTVQAAIHHLRDWVAKGTSPPKAPLLTTTGSPAAYVVDANGNVEGGVRSPQVDAPVATLSGLGQSGSSFCGLFGTTTPLTPEQLGALYENHGRFVSQWVRATDRAVQKGYVLRADAKALKAAGRESEIGR